MTTEQLHGFRANAVSGRIERYQVLKINPATIRFRDFGGVKQERTHNEDDNYGWFSKFEEAAAWLQEKLEAQRLEALEVIREIDDSLAKINERKYLNVVPLPYDTEIVLE